MATSPIEHDLKATIRTIANYPKPGIMFRDITTLLGDARAFRRAVDELVQPWAGGKIDKVAGIEARGFTWCATAPPRMKPRASMPATLSILPPAQGCAVDELVQPWAGGKIDKVAGIEARGFILGGAVAHQVSAGFVPIRKKGKLPHKRVSIAYSLEYGLDEMEMHEDAVAEGHRVILVDDLIATGGTAEGAVKLLRQLGAQVLAACFIIDLPELGGADKLRKLDVPVRTLLSFEGH